MKKVGYDSLIVTVFLFVDHYIIHLTIYNVINNKVIIVHDE